MSNMAIIIIISIALLTIIFTVIYFKSFYLNKSEKELLEIIKVALHDSRNNVSVEDTKWSYIRIETPNGKIQFLPFNNKYKERIVIDGKGFEIREGLAKKLADEYLIYCKNKAYEMLL